MLKRYLASRWAPWAVLLMAVLVHVLVTLAGADPFRMIDLKVYVDGTRHISDGSLYDYFSEPLHLPFTYPPFSVLLFAVISWIPWVVLRILWQAASFAAVAVMIHATLRLLGRAGPRAPDPLPQVPGIVITGTALAVFLEPVRTTLNYGQINLFLAAMLLLGAAAARQWAAGATVGLAAGIKLVPAVTGLYYLLLRRWTAVVASIVTFTATVGIALVVLPRQTVRFYTELMLDPGRTGPVFSAINQSWRGAFTRLAGRDDVAAAVAAAAGVTMVIGLLATWWSVRAGDRTGAFLAVQFIGLLVSPISWSHHWVWVLPLLIWAIFGAHRHTVAARVLAIGWLLATCSYLVSILISLQDEFTASRAGWQSWLGTVYAVLGLCTLIALAALNRGVRTPDDSDAPAQASAA